LKGKLQRVFASTFINIAQTSVQFKILLTPNWSQWTAHSSASAGLGSVYTRHIFLSQRDETEVASNFDMPQVCTLRRTGGNKFISLCSGVWGHAAGGAVG